MKKSGFSYIFLFFLYSTIYSQDYITSIYDPSINAVNQIHQAIDLADSNCKHVLIQIGGDWCPWCIKLHNFIIEHKAIDSLIQADFVFIHVNYSKENKNPEAMQLLNFPQRFGFPVLVVLDQSGKRIHTQNTACLEENDTYNEKEIFGFLTSWNKYAIDPERYK